jgi:predicted signal transduction protein with EAL and GGDEF domain
LQICKKEFDMTTEIVTLCEYASSNDGHLNIFDTFDSLVVTKLPWRAYFYAVAKIDVSDNKKDYKEVSLSVINTDGEQQIFNTKSKYNAERNLEKVNIVAGFKGLIFECEGEYIFRVSFDEDVVVNYKFKVIKRYE